MRKLQLISSIKHYCYLKMSSIFLFSSPAVFSSFDWEVSNANVLATYCDRMFGFRSPDHVSSANNSDAYKLSST